MFPEDVIVVGSLREQSIDMIVEQATIFLGIKGSEAGDHKAL